MSADAAEFWVFGYGSLMWRPGFPYTRALHARLVGHARAFCIYSIHYRGNLERPGLVLGLDQGGTCEGMAFQVAPKHAHDVLTYLREREQVTGVYREAHVPIELMDGSGREVMALTYLAEPAHPGYAGHLPLPRQARIIRGAHGDAGTNLEYVVNTLAHLRSLNIKEPGLERLANVISPLMTHACRDTNVAPRARALANVTRGQPNGLRPQRTDQHMRFVFRRVLGL